MLNYFAMKHSILKQYALLVVLGVVLSACSGPVENGSSSNTNSAQAQSNNNSVAQPNVAQNGTPTPVPTPAPPAVQQIPNPAPTDKAAPPQNANSAAAARAPDARAPKLVLSDKKIDYGKQDQGKTLVRAIAVKNGGKSNLNIESVVPS